MSENTYRLNCDDYVLHRDGQPIGPLLPTVAIAFDKETGTLHKHGAPASVSAWLRATQHALRSGGQSDLAEALIMLEGKFPIAELNKCISTSGHILRLYQSFGFKDTTPHKAP